MRTVDFYKHTRLAMLAMIALSMAFFTSCGEDEDEPDAGGTTLVEDGFYIQGDASNFSALSLNGSFSTTRNEVTQEDRATLFEAYIPLQAGTSGFKIVQVAGATQTTWGAMNVETITGGTNDQPATDFQRGELSSDASAASFNVDVDGLYHVVYDTEVGKFLIVPVHHWGVIGGATPGGWGSDQILPSTGFDFNAMTFTLADIAMTAGDFKFRYGSGWKVELDSTYTGTNSAGDAYTGIKVNANFGGAVDNLVPGGDNITNTESGIYTASVNWTAASGISATMVKTAELPAADWSDVELGLVGDGLDYLGAQHNWDVTIGIGTPSVNGDVYTYDFGVYTVNSAGGGFKVREGQNWDGISLGYNDCTVTGTGAVEFEANGDGNFVPLANGAAYSMTLVIDAATDTREFIVNYQ